MDSNTRSTESIDPPDQSGTAIFVADVRKSYGRTTALQGLSMRVPAGSVYGLVGPNSAGKTTALRILATLERPDSGTARLMGLDIAREPHKVRERMGYMPDFFGVYDRLSVAEYLDFYAASYGIPRRQRRQLCDELMELMDLGNKRDSPADTLSRGLRQRLGLARSLVHDPLVLLLDEPAAGLDPEARLELHGVLRDLYALGKTIVISSHILAELAEMCTHIGIIREGQMMREGPLDSVQGASLEELYLSVMGREGATA